jgi:hypothetical protein
MKYTKCQNYVKRELGLNKTLVKPTSTGKAFVKYKPVRLKD